MTQLTRRDFLRLCGTSSIGFALAACGITPTATPAPTNTPLPTNTALPTATPTLTNTPAPTSTATATATSTVTATPRPPTLRNLADRLGVAFGTVATSDFINNPRYREYTETLLNTANTIMLAAPKEVNDDRLFANVAWREVIRKWDEVSASLLQGKIPEWVRVDFDRTDITVDFAKKNGMRIFFGHLFWTPVLPKSIFDSSFTNDELRKMLEFMVRTKVVRYRGKVDVWSVNEIVSQSLYGPAENKYVFQRLGTDFVEDVFRWAHESDPQAKLMFNDSHIEQPDNPLFTKISETTLEFLRKYKQKGVPVDLVGSHFHTWIYDPPNFQIVRQVIKTIKDMGYDFWASEVTVNIADRDPIAPRKKKVEISGDLLQAQAQFYRELLETILDYNGGFMMFDFSDFPYEMFAKDFNLPEARAHIFDGNFKPKPAYYAMYDVLYKRASAKKTP